MEGERVWGRAIAVLLLVFAGLVSTTGPAQAAVAAPTGVTAIRGPANEVTVNWNAATGGTGAVQYVVKAYTTANGMATWDACATTSTTCSGTDLLHVPRVSEAWIEVTATDSSTSASAARVKLDALPSAPSAPTIVAGNGALTPTWAWSASGAGVTPTGFIARAFTEVQGGTAAASCSTTTDHSCPISGLANGTTYYIDVSATTSSGEGDPSARTAATPFSAPTAPTNVRTQAADSVVTVSWAGPDSDGGSAVTGYRAEAFAGASGGTALSACEPATLSSMSCDITALTNGMTYYVEVTARNGAGTGTASARVSVQPGTRSTAPRSVVVTRGDRTLVVEWLAPSSDGGSSITGYTVSAFTESYGGTTIGTCTTTSLTCVIGGVTNSTTYYVGVVATTAVGTSQSSNRVTVRMSAPPSAPRSVVAAPGNGFAVVSWRVPESLNGSVITKYVARAYREPWSGDPIAECSPVDSSLRCELGPLPNSTTYYVDVIAITARFTSEPSSPRVSVLTAAVPDVPREVSVRQRDDGIDVSWRTPNADGGLPITQYTASAYSSATSTKAVGECSTSGATCTIARVSGPPVYIDVVATNSAGDSAASAPRIRFVIGGLPGAPRDVIARREGERLRVSWLPPVDNGGSRITGYAVTARDSSGLALSRCSGVVLKGSTRWGCSLPQRRVVDVVVSGTNANGTTSASAIEVGGTVMLPPRDLALLPAENAIIASAARSLTDRPTTTYVFRAWSKPGGGRLLSSCSTKADTGDQFTCAILRIENYQTAWVDAISVEAGKESRPTRRLPLKPMASPPSMPRDLTLSQTDKGLVVRWQAPLSDGGYAITSTTATATTAAEGGSTLGSCTAKAQQTSCTITGLTTDYVYVHVQATNRVGAGAESAAVGRNLR